MAPDTRRRQCSGSSFLEGTLPNIPEHLKSSYKKHSLCPCLLAERNAAHLSPFTAENSLNARIMGKTAIDPSSAHQHNSEE